MIEDATGRDREQRQVPHRGFATTIGERADCLRPSGTTIETNPRTPEHVPVPPKRNRCARQGLQGVSLFDWVASGRWIVGQGATDPGTALAASL